jgi:hypothetical protein
VVAVELVAIKKLSPVNCKTVNLLKQAKADLILSQALTNGYLLQVMVVIMVMAEPADNHTVLVVEAVASYPMVANTKANTAADNGDGAVTPFSTALQAA